MKNSVDKNIFCDAPSIIVFAGMGDNTWITLSNIKKSSDEHLRMPSYFKQTPQ